ncbi:cell wall anchor protein [Salinispora arenicola]|uniref:RCC1 domain-containing protein n=1 Tax=Salinispora arenicola TaxID=168697 RepID=UPI0014302504|nr:Ig-like domain repeat protein [Salinispora arenicola]NIL42572.1 cell wall anchor protein [Salinispora arenicola]
MQGRCQRLGVGEHRAGRVALGWFILALAVTLAQSIGASPGWAQYRSAATAVVSDTILAWGENDGGQLGNGTMTDSSEPVAVSLPAGTAVAAVAAGDRHSLALTSAGTVLAWGRNIEGQLGNGSTTSSSTPVAVSLPTGTRAVAVAAGADHSLALTSAGTILAWGDNSFGQLGDGSTTDRSTPVAVSLPAGTTLAAIAAGRDHNLVLTSTGPTLLTWGKNTRGQLGDGTTTGRDTPVAVTLPPGVTVTSVAGGRDHSLVLTSDDTALAWGGNSFGQLGNGTTTDSLVPIAVALPTGTEATAIAAGRLHSAALTSEGAAFAWGHNGRGQLGNGSTTDSSEPVAVSLPADTRLTAIAGRDSDHNVTITSAGAALAWGANANGELGDGSTTDRSTPVAVSLPAGTTLAAIAAGDDQSMALPTLPPRSTTSLRVSPQDPTADQDVTLTATVTCNIDTPTGTITFRNNNTDLATVPLDSTTTATHTTRLPPGTHTLTAHYTATTTTCPDSQSEATTISVDLPVTGPDLPTILGAGTLLILTGATLIHRTHRRRSPHHPH